MKQVMGALGQWRRAMKDRSGATAIEYALIAGSISIVIIVAVGLIGGSVSELFGSVVDALGGGGFPDPCDQGGTNCGNN